MRVCVFLSLPLHGVGRMYISLGCVCMRGSAFPPTERPGAPPPPPTLEIGTKVLDHWRQRRLKENLLDLVEGEKMGFHPKWLYSKYSVFSGESNNG